MKSTNVVYFICILISDFADGSQIGKQFSSAIQKEDASLRIINGRKVPITNYPYLASLMIGGTIFGSGVIIDKRWVLTTAFNVAWYDKSSIKFRVGSNKYSSGGQVLETEDVIFHDNYTGSWDYNIAVVRVKQIKFGKKVHLINMATKDLKGGTKANIAGWGETDDTRNPSEVLLESDVTVFDWDSCHKNYTSDLTPRLMCTFDKEKGPCVYDFGDPLVTGKLLYGLFAGAYDCIPGNNAVLYTDVASLNDWVKKTISQYIIA